MQRFYTRKYLTGGLQLSAWCLAGILGLTKSETLPVIPIGLLFLWLVFDFMWIIMGKFTDKEGMPVIDWI